MKTKKMTVNLFASIIAFVVQFFISFWLSPYVVGKLGEEAYGFLNLANNFVSYASLLAVAINSMACRFISVAYNKGDIKEAKNYYSSVFWSNCLIYFLVFILSIIFIYNIQTILSVTNGLVWQVKVTFFLSFVNLGFSFIGTVYTAATFSTNNMHLGSIIQIIANVVKSILIILLFILLPPRIYYLSIAILVNGAIVFFGNYFISKKLFDDFTVSHKMININCIITLIKSGSWMLLSNISNLLLNGVDLLLTNQLISSAMMGRLSIAKQIPFAISSILGYFSSIFNASLTETYAKGTSKSIVNEIELLLKMLSFLLSVPFAGIIIYGHDFLNLWLSKSNYSFNELNQIYFLMLIVLLDIIVSTYMYSIHSVFIALNKIKFYSITLFFSSLISVVVTVFLVKNTGLGIYAISGTSTIVLGITHGFIVPIYAAKLLNEKKSIFLIRELKSWGTLILISSVFMIIRICFNVTSWGILINCIILSAIVGYILSFFLIFSRSEQKSILNRFRLMSK